MDSREIKRRLAKLEALEAGGVDNWQYYDVALKDYNALNRKEELAEKVIEKLLDVLSSGIEEPAGRGCGYGFKEGVPREALDILMTCVEKFSEDIC